MLNLSGVKPATLALASGANEITALSFVNIYDTLFWTHVPYGVAQVTGGGYQSESDSYFGYLASESVTLNTTQKDAIDSLVSWLKTENLYASMHDLWLIPSATSKAVAQRGFKSNLMSSTINDVDFTLSASGLKGNGSKGLSLGISPATIGTGDHQISVYIQNKGTIDASFQIGTRYHFTETGYSFISTRNAAMYSAMMGAGTSDDYTLTSGYAHANGMFTLTKPSSVLKLVRNGTELGHTAVTGGDDTLATLPYTLFALNHQTGTTPSPQGMSDCTISFVSIGKTPMTVAQAQSFYTKVQAIQVAFNRAV